jgi:SepF-like predicted cell division protein (DUF552 family)
MQIKNSRIVSFEVFRFQILPISKRIQLTIDNELNSFEDLVEKKNQLLSDVLNKPKLTFEHSKSKITLRFDGTDDNISLFRINVLRKLQRHTPDFKEEQIEDYPAVTFAIHNEKTKQLIAIEKNSKAFAHPDTVSKLIENNLNRHLKPKNLAIYIESIYSKEDFWEIVEKYENRIKQLDFELIRPNMSNISSKIDEQLKALGKSMDAHILNLKFQSSKDAKLIIDRENEQIDGLVDYASQGGGNISFKVKGLRKKVKTTKTPTEINIDEMELKSLSSQELIEILRLLL